LQVKGCRLTPGRPPALADLGPPAGGRTAVRPPSRRPPRPRPHAAAVGVLPPLKMVATVGHTPVRRTRSNNVISGTPEERAVNGLSIWIGSGNGIGSGCDPMYRDRRGAARLGVPVIRGTRRVPASGRPTYEARRQPWRRRCRPCARRTRPGLRGSRHPRPRVP
jgi:hypothetical protein